MSSRSNKSHPLDLRCVFFIFFYSPFIFIYLILFSFILSSTGHTPLSPHHSAISVTLCWSCQSLPFPVSISLYLPILAFFLFLSSCWFPTLPTLSDSTKKDRAYIHDCENISAGFSFCTSIFYMNCIYIAPSRMRGMYAALLFVYETFMPIPKWCKPSLVLFYWYWKMDYFCIHWEEFRWFLVKSERELCDFIDQHIFICVLSNAFVLVQFIPSQCSEMWIYIPLEL